MPKIVTIVGARPQFIKAAAVSREIRKYFKEILVHTGQHYDRDMSQVFFDELKIPKPDYNLNIGSGSHGEQTGKMLVGIEEVLTKEKPDIVLIYGDTNSTLAGALAASKMHIPVTHVEAGLRSYNKEMPEEINRILSDHISEFLFCPTQTAVQNLKKENITKGVHNVGDVMLDAMLFNVKIAEEKSDILKRMGLSSKSYVLATIHRAENTDNRDRLKGIVNGFSLSNQKIVLPLHPRTRKILEKQNIKLGKNIIFCDPVGYLDMLVLEKNAKIIATDSGGIQKESYFMKVPCVTLRDETEWVETLEDNNNVLVGANMERISREIQSDKTFSKNSRNYFGTGKASKKIADILKDNNE